MKRFLATTAVVLIGGLGVTSVAEAAPNVVKIVTVDGKKRIKVGKKLPFLVSCSKDCSGKLSIKLVTPATTEPASGNVSLAAGNIFRARFLLTNFGRRYVKNNVGRCSLKVKFAAVDLDTGKRTVKKKTFRFYK